MKRIFRNIQILVLGIALLAVSSCKGWLDEEPTTGLSLDDLTGEKAMRALVVGAVSTLKKTVEINSNLDFAGTDELRVTNNNTNGVTLDRYLSTPSSKVVDNCWTYCYSTIQSCNIVINRTNNDPNISEGTKQNIIAQARFIRAYTYFKLVQWFGAIPLEVDETQSYDHVTLYNTRAPIWLIYDQIISDLTNASTVGVLSDEPINAYPTRYAAKGLLAKVYLTMGTSKARLGWNQDMGQNHVIMQYADLAQEPEYYYNKSFLLLDEIVKSGIFELQREYGDNFSVESAKKFWGSYNKESMWELPFSSQPGYGSSWSKLMGQDVSGANLYLFNAMAGQKIFAPVPSFWSSFKKGDVRRRWNYSDQKINYTDDNNPMGPVKLNNHTIPPESEGYDLVNIYNGSVTAEKKLYDVNSNNGATKYRWGTGDPTKMWQMHMDFQIPTNNLPTNVIVLRYADILLMYVEVDMLLGGANPGNLSSTGASAKAMDIMNNQILYRARGNKTEAEMLANGTDTWGDSYTGQAVTGMDVYNYQRDYNTSDNPLTFGELVRQRSCELCYEFHRWNDLVRWGLLEQVYASRISSSSNVVLTHKNYLFPIPLSEIQASHNKDSYYNNPGY